MINEINISYLIEIFKEINIQIHFIAMMQKVNEKAE